VLTGFAKWGEEMAQKVQVLLVCDLHDDEVEGTETITFGLDGSSYEIDVCAAHASQLRDDFASYVGAARRAGRPPVAKGKPRPAAKAGGNQRVAEIREWARQNGHQVSERGRLSADLVAAFDKAN
jgi:hypothetical protein